MTDPFKTYLQSLQADLARGNATEHTHRPALKSLIETLGEHLTATNEPKQITDCGKPDVAVYRGLVLLGYLETKDVGINLDIEEKGPQLKRYREALPNLILTDYLEFRWYVKGERRAVVSLGHVERDGKIKTNKEALAAGGELLAQFLALKLPSIGTAKELALRMAKLAGLMHNAALKTLEMEPPTGTLKGWLTAFEKTLVPNLSPEQFSDMYAQTLTYGLFAARVSIGEGQDLRRDTAAGLLPETNPFLKRLFYHLAGPEVPSTVSWVVDDMVSLLNAADMEAVMADFGRGSLEKDPVVHFYETFLAAYDPEKRKVRGVYYTPEPVVSYIVRAIDHLLKERFDRPWGLADRNTLILDPACGTGTFLHSVIALIYDTLCAQGQAGGWSSYVSQSLLPRIFGFELLMAPYAVAHLKLGLLLQEKGFDFPPGQRLGVYLTNTLSEGIKTSEALYGPIGYITEESNSAARIKKEDPIEVVLGNPPYAGHSANASLRREAGLTGAVKTVRTFIGRLIEDYKQVDGKPLGEKNPKWLQDDYVKFIRWGQWRITQTGMGILAMITNHGYLDNPTFRGMRQQLMQSFSEIYLLNLHGNTKKKEVCPDGSKDENVFDIQQGVAIGLFVKSPGSSGSARVYYADLWGNREAKNQTLAQMEVSTTSWQELQPHSPFYLFVPQDTDLRAEYDRGWPVNEIFPINSAGIVTARDNLTIHWTRQEVMDTVKDFTALDPETAREKYHLGEDVRDWKVELAQKDLKASGLKEKLIRPVLYRPFDRRFTYYTGQTRGFICMPRPEVMGHILAGDNLGLIATRQTRDEWAVLSTRFIMGHKSLAAFDINTLFPLYLYSKVLGQVIKTPNINPAFIEDLSGKVGLAFVPEGRGDLETTMGPKDAFFYAYAVFHSPTYRERYSEFLKGDFPRLPLTGNKGLFKALVGLGAELVSLHLMESPRLETFITKFPIPGSQVVEEVRYQDNVRRVYINSEQFFEGIPPEVWAFTTGGYQVCHKWLKDRKGRTLTFGDLHHYQKIIVALAETIRLIGEIDGVIDSHGSWPIDLEFAGGPGDDC
ncbi:MAG: type ISP restriction/modification enzyme [Desulfobaccales bacterium]